MDEDVKAYCKLKAFRRKLESLLSYFEWKD